MNEKLYLDKRFAKADGTFPIKLYVRHKNKFLMSTNIYTTFEAWDESGCINKNDKQYKVKNAILRKLLSDAENEYMRLQSIGALPKTDKEYRAHLECVLFGKEQPKENVLSYFDKMIATKAKRNTIKTYTTTKRMVKEFDPDCTFDTIDKHWLERFDRWLAERISINSKWLVFSKLRAVFNQAIDDGITANYPFRKFRVRKEETRKRCLTVGQLRLLRDADTKDTHTRCRDIFMLTFYLIGINIGDLCLLKKTDLHNGRIEYYRQKTHKLVSVKVEPEAMAIIGKYKGKGEWLLNILDKNPDYVIFSASSNRALKLIKVDDNGTTFPFLSTYWARHTWATIAAELDIPKETIAHALSHSVNDVTSIYIKFDNRKVDEANRKVIDYVNGME